MSNNHDKPVETQTVDTLRATYDRASGRLEFEVPNNAIIAGGLLAMLEAIVKVQRIGPAVTPRIAVAGAVPDFSRPTD